MKTLSTQILFIVLAMLAVCCTNVEKTSNDPQTETVSIATLISRQSRLYTSEYIVHKIVTHNDLRKLKGSLFGIKFNQTISIGDRKIAIPIDVTLQAYIDFSEVSEENIEIVEEKEGDILHITLPDPKIVVASSKVDNKGIRTKVSWLRNDFKDSELTDFTQQGMASILRSVPQMGIIESARENAASLLIPLLADMGYEKENIVITFRKKYDESDLYQLYDYERSNLKLRQVQ